MINAIISHYLMNHGLHDILIVLRSVDTMLFSRYLVVHKHLRIEFQVETFCSFPVSYSRTEYATRASPFHHILETVQVQPQ